MRARPPIHLVLLLAGACQAPTADSSAATTTPGITTVSDGTTTGPSAGSSSEGSTSKHDGSASGSADTSEPGRDLGFTADFGDGQPVGCKGKIDLLFMISRDSNMRYRQDQIAAALPKFIDTIQSKFADFDYHIMVVDGDGPPPGAWWGSSVCNSVCPNLACTVGQPCCPWNDANKQGMPCCEDPNYPCDQLDLVKACDQAWGAGTRFPAGIFTADKICPIDASRRYLVKGQTDFEATFDCIARIGVSGYLMLGQAFAAAMQPDINAVGGCNQGFLRDDALLMVTFISTDPDDPGNLGSEGTAAEWAQAARDAKHGDDKSIVMLNIGGCNCPPHDGECHPDDRLCVLTATFPYHHRESILTPDYGPAFLKTAELVETACAGFVPPA